MKPKRPISGPEVLRMIVRRIEGGRYRPGERIVPAVISREIGSSTIPVREALCQLVGRETVTEQRHKGFFIAPMTSTTLRDLYGAHGLIIEAALQQCSPEVSLRVRKSDLWHLFAAIVRHSRNDALAGMQRHLSGRIMVFRKYETIHLKKSSLDSAIADTLRNGQITDSIRLIREFHHICQEAATAIWQACSDR